MPQQDRTSTTGQARVSYPCSASTRGKGGKLFHTHRVAWVTAIVTKKNDRRMFVKMNVAGQGEVVVWLPVSVIDAMLQYVVDKTGTRLNRLTKQQKHVLFAPSKKERVKRKPYIQDSPQKT